MISPWLNLNSIVSVLAIGMVLYHLSGVFYLLAEPLEHQNIHLAFAFLLVFLARIQESRKFLSLKVLLVLLSIVATGYIAISYQDLLDRAGFPVMADVIIGIVLIFLCLEGTRQNYGMILPGIVFLYIIYAFLGHLFPDPFETIYYPAHKIVGKLAVLQGIYGLVLGISADYIFGFIIFGAVIQVSGATEFFNQISRLVGRRFRSGPAMSAVVSSALFGTSSGSVIANIALTGSFTIPLMKKIGYKPYQAAAIEATASTGGQIMPPVMGATAFIMSGITGIPYIKLCAAAVIPAILYYYTAGLYVQFQAGKQNVSYLREDVDKRELLLTAPLFFMPLFVLITLMVSGYTAMFAIFWSLIPLVGLSLMRKKTRSPLRTWVNSLTKGAVTGAEIGVACGLIGVIVATTTMTGLGIKLPAAIKGWSGEILFVALLITAIVSIILGCGVTVAAVYILVAIMVIPALIEMGLTVLQAHLFAFYYAVISFITPPVALGSLFAARFAGAKFWPTGIEACKVGAAGLIVPFFIILCPAIILQPQPLSSAVTGLVSTFVILTAVQIAICNYYMTTINFLERILSLFIIGVLLLSFFVHHHVLFGLGVLVFVILTIGQLRKRPSP